MLDLCLSSLEKQVGVKPQIIVVDSGSTDGSPEMVAKKYPQVLLIRCSRIGIGEALNNGIRNAKSDIIVFDLNNDDYVASDWLENLLHVIRSNPEIGIVSGRRYQGSPGSTIIDTIGGKISHLTGNCTRIGMNKRDSVEFDIPRELDYTGVITTRKDVISKVGLLDPVYFLYYEDTDFCYRVKKQGYRISYVPTAKLWHRGSSTIGRASQTYVYYLRRGRIRFILKAFPAPWFLVPFLWTVLLRTCIDALVCFPPFAKVLSKSRLKFLVKLSGRQNFRAILSAIAWNIKNLRNTFESRLRETSLIRK